MIPFYNSELDTNYSRFECPVCRELVSAEGECECTDEYPENEFDHNDQYDTDSALESVYGPTEDYYEDYPEFYGYED